MSTFFTALETRGRRPAAAFPRQTSGAHFRGEDDAGGVPRGVITDPELASGAPLPMHFIDDALHRLRAWLSVAPHTVFDPVNPARLPCLRVLRARLFEA